MHFLFRQIPYSATLRINPDVVMQNMHVLFVCLVVSVLHSAFKTSPLSVAEGSIYGWFAL